MEPQAVSPRTAGEVYRDILEWAGTLPRWQQELLRRLLRKQDLSADDATELAFAAAAETEQQASIFAPISIEDLPSVAATSANPVLLAIRDLRNVNALRQDQTLSFGRQLTVVYGDNAAGKSGYARVLKKVYRARVVDDILGDVRAEVASPDTPRATFVVESADGAERTLVWEEGGHLADVGKFAVIDAACSLTYVRGGALAVGPAGIDVPRRFAEGVDSVKKQVARNAASALPDKRQLQHLENDSEAGRFVRALSSGTTDAEVAKATAWDAQMAASLEQAEKLLAEARSQTLSIRRNVLQSKLNAVESLGRRVAQWTAAVVADEMQALQVAQVALDDAEKSLRAVKDLADSEVPPAALDQAVWVDLLRAAATFVGTIVREDVERTLSVDGRCALCWQVLDDAAAQRVARFERHLEGVALRRRQEAAQKREAILARFRAIPDALTAEDQAVVAADDMLRVGIESLMNIVRARRDLALSYASDGRAMPTCDEVDSSSLEALRRLHASLRAELASLPTSESEAEIQMRRQEQQVLELATRRALSQVVEQIREFVAKLREHQRLRNAESAINTRAVSAKASELHAKHMTERYAALVDEELQELRFRRRRPYLFQKTSKANVEVAPLVSAELRHVPAEKVFSEGERTAIALACFMAELRLGDDAAGLIFDDPVSSLDHHVREHVARRIVTAAKQRQVIVFTHDLAFLADLREQSDKIQGVGCEFRTLVATDYAAGFVENDEPFGARAVRKRIGALRQLLATAERASRDGDLRALRSAAIEFYEALRSTWERFVEERLFAKVVQRLERHVIVGALGKVAYSKEMGERVLEGWRRCSNAIEAHDHAPSAGGQSHAIEEMKADLASLVDAEKAAPPA